MKTSSLWPLISAVAEHPGSVFLSHPLYFCELRVYHLHLLGIGAQRVAGIVARAVERIKYETVSVLAIWGATRAKNVRNQTDQHFLRLHHFIMEPDEREEFEPDLEEAERAAERLMELFRLKGYIGLSSSVDLSRLDDGEEDEDE